MSSYLNSLRKDYGYFLDDPVHDYYPHGITIVPCKDSDDRLLIVEFLHPKYVLHAGIQLLPKDPKEFDIDAERVYLKLTNRQLLEMGYHCSSSLREKYKANLDEIHRVIIGGKVPPTFWSRTRPVIYPTGEISLKNIHNRCTQALQSILQEQGMRALYENMVDESQPQEQPEAVTASVDASSVMDGVIEHLKGLLSGFSSMKNEILQTKEERDKAIALMEQAVEARDAAFASYEQLMTESDQYRRMYEIRDAEAYEAESKVRKLTAELQQFRSVPTGSRNLGNASRTLMKNL